VAIHLEIDPQRLKTLRTRLNRPLRVAAELAKVAEEELELWERTPTPLPLDKCQSIAKSYNRNWYIFLLEEEIGTPTVPHDFRKTRGQALPLGHESMLAFDNAGLLLDKIDSLALAASTGGSQSIIDQLPASLSDNPEAVAGKFRKLAAVSGQPEAKNAYDVLRFWRYRLSDEGLFVTQAKFPREEVRAFCLSRNRHHLVVLSNQDPAAARTFSLLHEVGHLLLGGDAMCKPTDWMEGQSEEPWCNRFAAAVLLPRSELQANPRYHELISSDIAIGSGRALAREFGVSELALFRRLETFGEITNAEYKLLQDETDAEWEDWDGPGAGFLEHPKRIVYTESPLFVRQVFEALGAGEIPYREVGSLLNIPVHSIPRVREEAF
jgi:Zn-dependent peptidase ImmA (M78 family)